MKTTTPENAPIAAADAIFEVWEALKRHLEARSRALAEEVRHYPGPIARCDVQLTKLLEQRTHAHDDLSRMGEARRPSLRAVREFVEACDASDDETGMKLIARLRAALGAHAKA